MSRIREKLWDLSDLVFNLTPVACDEEQLFLVHRRHGVHQSPSQHHRDIPPFVRCFPLSLSSRTEAKVSTNPIRQATGW